MGISINTNVAATRAGMCFSQPITPIFKRAWIAYPVVEELPNLRMTREDSLSR